MNFVLVLLRLMRPRQWTKNLVVFAGLAFSANLFKGALVSRTLQTFFIFCLTTGAVYIVNDILDREHDRLHPEKAKRPLAAGAISPETAGGMAFIFLAIALTWSFILSLPLGLTVLAYVALNAAYSLGLKRVVILDVIVISAGFVLRAVAGAVVIDVVISPWLLIVASLLSLFLGFAKRRHELVTLGEKAASHRPSLGEYSPVLLDQFLGMLSSCTIMAYSLNAFTSVTGREHNLLMLTVPFVIYGILRYLYLVYQKNQGGSPELVLLNDRPMLITIVLWMVTVGWILRQG
ncbi:MAG: decaprenyl-phosphate phosphoribosyltransferase [Candidatus Firestonebacteria bacterium]|nr:decaprenyl-phosphate phosphoribosyltransferase [Candidatus Firestonebacteria bacterium]